MFLIIPPLMSICENGHKSVRKEAIRLGLILFVPAEGRLSEKFTRLKNSHVGNNNKDKNKNNNNAENHSELGQNGTG